MSKLKFSTDSLNWTTATINTYDVSEWQLTNSNIGSTQVSLMDYGNGLWFAYDNNKITKSTDGINWFTVLGTAHGTNDIYSINYSNGIWLLGGSNGMRTSTDSMGWTTVSSNISSIIQYIGYGNGVWIAGGSTEVRRSTNSTIWNTVVSGRSAGGSDIAYGNGLWVIVGSNEITNSTDGITWNVVTSNFGTTTINTIAYGQGVFLAAGWQGQIRRSTNATNWTTVSSGTTNSLWSIAYNNNLWVMGGQGGSIFTSTNGISWSARTSNFGSGTFTYSIAYNNSLWVAAAFNGEARRSTDAINWTIVNATFTTAITSIAYNNGLWVAVGYAGRVSMSTDAIVWNFTPLNFGNSTVSAIKYVNGIWFVKPSNTPADARISTNGINWTTASFAFFDNNTIDYGQGKWLFAAGGTLRSSTDLISWTSLWTGATTSSLAYGNNLWIAASSSTTIRTSTDTVSWSAVSVDITAANKVFYGNNSWIISNASGNIRNSTDGRTGINSSNVNSNIYHNGLNIYINNNLWWMNDTSTISSSYNNTSISNDGINWTTIPIDLKVINSVTYGNNRWVIGGNSNNIYYTTNLGYKTISTFGNIKESENINGIWAANTSNNEILINRQGISELGKFSFVNTNSQTIKQISSYDSKFAFLEDKEIIESNDLKTFTTNYLSWITVYSELNSNDRFNKIKYFNNLWFAGGTSSYNPFMKSTDAINWTTINTFIPTDTNSSGFFGIEYGDGIWLAIAGGYSGTFRTSTDTINWTTIIPSPSPTGYLRGGAGFSYGNGMYFAAGSRQRGSKSTNGISWTTVNFNFGNSNAFIQSILFANNLWLFGTSRGQLYTSTDTVSWSIRSNLPFGTGSTIYSIKYANNTYVAVGSNSSYIGISTNGISWTSQLISAASSTFDRIAYGNGIWIVDGGLPSNSFSSTDLISWTTLLNTDFYLIGNYQNNDIEYGNGTWVIGNSSNSIQTYIYRSVNDKFNKVIKTKNDYGTYVLTNHKLIYEKKKYSSNWKVYNTQINDDFINGAVNVNYSSYDSVNTANIWNLTYWNLEGNATIYSLYYQNGVWLAGGTSGNLYSSTDITTWVTKTSNFGTSIIRSIAYGGGTWVAVGGTAIRTSTDTNIWTTVLSNFGNTQILSIDYGNGIWVAGGYAGQIRTSTNGISWITASSNFLAGEIIRGVSYGNNMWVIAGDNGKARTSTDAINWTTINPGIGGNPIYSIEYGNNLWLIGANNAIMSRSTNGLSWTNFYFITWVTNNITYSIKYANNVWIAAGTLGVFKSTDTISWITVSGSKMNHRSVEYGNGLWASLQTQNLITSEQIYNPDLYDIIGNNASYRSTDLMSWTTIVSLSTPIINQTEINDITSTN